MCCSAGGSDGTADKDTQLQRNATKAEARFDQELRQSMTSKEQAASSMREWVMYRRYEELRAEIADLKEGRLCRGLPRPDDSER